ncbi:MAG: DUF262 domain-containing protein [Gammaproteobacteria bacterium]|nr:DUF262 domain-containing protein [Gammaproteobacteria bacterium]MYF67338.1 DUF262 domain-containing protein [Gammaproteobacteria bacterium]MYK36771.1 DUF262 domain-containing protein [Gammaproteobacteria bacterium]
MAVTVFKDSSYNVSGLLSRIQHGEIALPDIQRPFVWTNARVRDLFDSMYKGFPVGYLLLWSTGAGAGAKQIGTDDKQAAPSLLIVDGQQRLTSLFAVITGTPVVRKDYSQGRIRLAFRPHDQTFEVTDAAVENDPEFIPDISEVFQGAFHSFTTRYLERVQAYRDVELDEAEKNRLVENIDRLKDLQNYPFQAIELDRTVDEEHVAEVFVRINSEGVRLSNADFILTLMSVFWEKGRRELETFARLAKAPSTRGPSPFNYFIEPSPDQLLRSSVGLAFRRGRLRYVYSILRGKDLDTGEFSSERREAQFTRLQAAHEATLDLTNWHEYLKCLRHAGFRSGRMVSSQAALIFVYILWLLGRRDFDVQLKRLREVIARWWFMAHTTGRYTGSAETQLEADLSRIGDLPPGDADSFCETLDRIVRDTFTKDYWDITLPNRLDTSAAKSPPLAAYWAALNLLEAEVLFSAQKVSAMLDPAVTPVKDMERHHLFPRAYLESIHITEHARVNAIANMSFVDWSDNLEISNSSPQIYWPKMAARMDPERIKRQEYWHALPVGWEQLDYGEFCEKRRRLIGQVVRKGFEKLWDSQVESTRDHSLIQDLIADGESNVLEFKESARWSYGTDKKGKSEQIIVKSVAGFMNSEGGTLLIGVADDGTIKGLKQDYETLSRGHRDGYELFLTQLIGDKITGPSPSLCRISFQEVDGRDVCRVDVAASSKPVFARPMNSREFTDFWVRQGNKTEQFYGRELLDYKEDHWG